MALHAAMAWHTSPTHEEGHSKRYVVRRIECRYLINIRTHLKDFKVMLINSIVSVLKCGVNKFSSAHNTLAFFPFQIRRMRKVHIKDLTLQWIPVFRLQILNSCTSIKLNDAWSLLCFSSLNHRENYCRATDWIIKRHVFLTAVTSVL